MIRSYSTEAIILSRKNSGEADKIITLFTKKHGKIKVFAKGIRKINSRRSASLEIFSKINAFLHLSKNFEYITEVIILDSYINIRKKLGRIAYAYIFSEIIEKLTAENQENRYIYNLLVDVLTKLNQFDLNIQTAQILLSNFKKSVLYNLGFIENINYSNIEIDQIITQIVETKLKSPKLLTNII